MHVIDADKSLEFVETGMIHSKFCARAEPVTQNGEYDVVSGIIRHMDLFTYNQLKLFKNYIIENMV